MEQKMMNDDEPLMRMGAPTNAEKLLWERHVNKVLSDELKELQKELSDLKVEFNEYKTSILNNNIAQMLNKMNKIKADKLLIDAKLSKLRKDNEELILRCIKLQVEKL
jgi:hypothetical protein